MGNQQSYVQAHKDFYLKTAAKYTLHVDDLTDVIELALEHHADPHIKKALRIIAMKELKDSGRLGDKVWLDLVKYKIKKGEWAKNGKLPRAIGDLGVAASLQGAWITAQLKECMYREVIEYRGGVMRFCKRPSESDLTDIFNNLIDPPGRYYYVYFSDDSSLSVRRNDGGVDLYNLDIKSCDASHGPGIFDALRAITPHPLQDGLDVLIRQLKLNFRVVNPHVKDEFVELRSGRPRLYSGSTITTAINNVACITIGHAIANLVEIHTASIEAAAESTGYVLTGTTPLAGAHELQFLKHSPVLDTAGIYRPVLNLGVLLRTSGVCKGDLPGRGPVEARAVQFQQALLQGMYPRTSIPCVDAMKANVAHAKPRKQTCVVVERQLAYKTMEDQRAVRTFSNEEVFRRYDLTHDEIALLHYAFCNIGYQLSWACSATHKIFQADYGLSAEFL